MTIRANSPRQRFQKRASPLAFRSEFSCRAVHFFRGVFRDDVQGGFQTFFSCGSGVFILVFSSVLLRSEAGFVFLQGGEFRRTAVWERGRRSWDAREWRLVYRVGLFEFSQFGRIRIILILQGMEFLLALRQRFAHVFNVKAQVLKVAAFGGQIIYILHREGLS